MKASEVPVGEWFVACMGAGELRACESRREVPGEQIHVSVRCGGEDEARVILAAFSQLPFDHVCQAQEKGVVWVCGVRRNRSKKVHVVETAVPLPGGRPVLHLTEMVELLGGMTSAQPTQHRQYREAKAYLYEEWEGGTR